MSRIKITGQGADFGIEQAFKKGKGKNRSIKEPTYLGKSITIKSYTKDGHLPLRLNYNSTIKFCNANGQHLKKGLFGVGGPSKDKVETAFLAAVGRIDDLHAKAEALEKAGKIKKSLEIYRLAAFKGHKASEDKVHELEERIDAKFEKHHVLKEKSSN